MASEREAPAAGGTGGAVTEGEAAFLALINAHRATSGYAALPDMDAVRRAYMASPKDGMGERWLEHERRKSDAALAAAAAVRDPSPAEAEVRALRSEVERLTEERDEARDLNATYLNTPVGEWIARAAAAEADVARVRKALDTLRSAAEPLAVAANHYAYADPSDLVMSRRAYIAGPDYPAPTVTVEQVRALAAALADHAPTPAGPASRNSGPQSATPTSAGDEHGR